MKRILPVFLILLGAVVFVNLFDAFVSKDSGGNLLHPFTPSEIAKHYSSPSPTASPTPTPTPRPLTFAEMNALYGPCVFLPTLLYHHIQSWEDAKQKGQTALSVDTDYFRNQMKHLKDKGYVTASMNDLVNFFDNGILIPTGSILLTFDDAYIDFATDAVPILREFGFKATLFAPTGLINNPGYLSWDTISSITPGGDILFANHTWSHHNLMAQESVIEKEISTADTQLAERGLNNPKVFAYPYGLPNASAETFLTKLGYKLAFTTRPGSALCKKQRLELPRIRIGNTDLSFYGF